MQELINKVAASAGISNEQAAKSIETISQYIKDKMPYVMHQHIDSIIEGGTMSDAFKKQVQVLADETEVGLRS